MKRLTKMLLMLGVASAFTATTASSQILYNLQLDENGNLSINGSPAGVGARAVDPISGMEGLKYDASGIGAPWTPGDLFLTHPGTTEYSDLIRWEVNLVGFASAVYFFSLLNDEPGEPVTLADVPVLPPPYPGLNPVFRDEVGGRCLYIPTPNEPGGSPLAPNAIAYTIISDVPEPSAVALLGLAGGLLAVFRGRR